jgi:hypothetical protein
MGLGPIHYIHIRGSGLYIFHGHILVRLKHIYKLVCPRIASNITFVFTDLLIGQLIPQHVQHIYLTRCIILIGR